MEDFEGKTGQRLYVITTRRLNISKGIIRKRLQDFEKKDEGADQANITYNNGDLLSATSGENLGDDWILNSGCSYHMCTDRNYFDSYKQANCGTITMMDNSTYKVIGIGMVKIKIFDDVVKTVGGVRHVPGLGRA